MLPLPNLNVLGNLCFNDFIVCFDIFAHVLQRVHTNLSVYFILICSLFYLYIYNQIILINYLHEYLMNPA